MIRSIVFDMGNVLLRFDTRGLVRSHTGSDGDADLLWRAGPGGPWWNRLDRGGDEGEVLEGILRDLPERLWPNARAMMERWDDFLTPIPETVALAKELGEKGYGLYLLSNTPRRFQRFRTKLPVLEQFDGLVRSCDEGLLKPDPALYRVLFDRYGLKPEECFFIDDNPMNVECAWHLGMRAHRFQGDVTALRRELRDCGVDAAL